MKDQADYSKYRCPYSHIEKECGHELHGPEGYADTYGVWCACGFRGPVFCLDPEELGLKALEAVATGAQQRKGKICPSCKGTGMEKWPSGAVSTCGGSCKGTGRLSPVA